MYSAARPFPTTGRRLVSTIPGGPGTPSITLNSVPPKGSSAQLTGTVLHVLPTGYYVAVFIRVAGGWWTKPYFSDWKTPLNPDGTWTCSIVTGGNDQDADHIAAYVLPVSYSVPPASGDASIPAGVDANAVAKAIVSR